MEEKKWRRGKVERIRKKNGGGGMRDEVGQSSKEERGRRSKG